MGANAMTPAKRRVIRETNELNGPSGKPYVLRIDPGGATVSIKIKGRRTWFTVTTKQIFTMGAWNAAAAIRAKKRADREEKRRAS